MIIVNKTTLQKLSEYEFRQLHPNTSFPSVLSNEALEGFDYEVLQEPTFPQLTKYQSAQLGSPYLDAEENIVIEYEIITNTPSVEQLLLEYEVAIDAHLDAKAKEYKYNNVYTMISYCNDPNPKFANEAESMFVWRSNVWTTANALVEDYLESVGLGNNPTIPTVESVIASLPEFELL
jgi:hypothetical protein